MMRVIIIFCIFNIVYGAKIKHEVSKCDGILIEKKCHIKEILSNGINRPYQLSRYNNTLFFSYNTGDEDKDTFEIGYVTSDQRVPVTINSTKNGFATAVDEKNNIAYFGGSDGIYEHHITKLGDMKHVIKGKDIWDMFFKQHLYFIVYPSQRLYKKVGNDSELVNHISEKIYHFAIDGNENTYITTKEGLFEIKNGTSERILLKGPKIFRAIAVNDGVPYFCSQSGIYVINKDEEHALKKIIHIENIFGLTFDGDGNFIYSDPHEIVRILPEAVEKH